jgi:uncharacterized protein DUF4326
MRVINLKDKPRSTDGYVYIGRRQWCGKGLFEASPFTNYFSVKRYGREKAIRLYEEKLRSRPDLMARLPELKGKTALACWCAPEKCHGHVLIKLLEEEGLLEVEDKSLWEQRSMVTSHVGV